MQKTILDDTSLTTHLQNYARDKHAYSAAVADVYTNEDLRKSVTTTNKSRVLATLVQNLDRTTFDTLLPHIDLPEITRACGILDARRHIHQLEAKIQRTSARSSRMKRKRQYMCNSINVLNGLLPDDNDTKLTLTSSKIGMVKTWIQSLDEENLTQRALIGFKDDWKTLADYCHFNPKDFKLAWFLSWCFGVDAPEDSIVYKIDHSNEDKFLTIYEEYKLPYSFVRLKAKNFSHHKRERLNLKVAERESLRTVLWWYDELRSNLVDDVICDRLAGVNAVDLPYGAMVDLLMNVNHPRLKALLSELAQNKTTEYKLNLESPVVVLCDASASMQVAIRTSSIVTSLLCSLAKAELRVFREKDYDYKAPTTVAEAIKTATSNQACNCTAPAASLHPYERAQKVVKTFIVVTDEEENTGYDKDQSYWNMRCLGDTYFAKTYKRYIENVYRAKLIFISFTDQSRDGNMIRDLKEVLGEGTVSELVEVYKFEGTNPDLKRLDYILTKLSVTPPDNESVASLDEAVLV